LRSGYDAIECIEKGIQILETHSDKSDNGIANILSSAYCSLAETYCTDLCDDINAEEKCDHYNKMAYHICPENPDVLISIANLRIIQERFDEARDYLDSFLQVYYALVDENNCEDEPCIDMDYNLRYSAVQLLLELHYNEDAANIIELLLLENDSMLEIWYLAGIAYGSFEPETGIQYLNHLLKVGCFS